MSSIKSSGKESAQVARAILHDRQARRKMMMRILLFLVGMLALGTWLIDDFLAESTWLFCAYWGALFLGVLFLILFCLYDILKVMQER
jgi:hypothetical protein